MTGGRAGGLCTRNGGPRLDSDAEVGPAGRQLQRAGDATRRQASHGAAEEQVHRQRACARGPRRRRRLSGVHSNAQPRALKEPLLAGGTGLAFTFLGAQLKNQENESKQEVPKLCRLCARPLAYPPKR